MIIDIIPERMAGIQIKGKGWLIMAVCSQVSPQEMETPAIIKASMTNMKRYRKGLGAPPHKHLPSNPTHPRGQRRYS